MPQETARLFAKEVERLLEAAKARRREPPLVDHANVVVKQSHLQGSGVTATDLNRLAARLAAERGVSHQLFTTHSPDTRHTYSFQFNERNRARRARR